jgi:hypothetical protein
MVADKPAQASRFRSLWGTTGFELARGVYARLPGLCKK